MTTIAQRSSKLATELSSANMRAKEYSKGPFAQEIMALRIGSLGGGNGVKSEGIRIWTGKAEMDITGVNKRARQAVVAVDESARQIEREYTVTVYAYNGLPVDNYDVRRVASQQFPVFIQGMSKFRLLDWHDIEHTYGSSSHRIRVKASRSIPETKMTLLMGMDETSHFIASLPERVASVKEAHEVLRPSEVPVGSLRQGEWFFVPATDEEIETLVTSISRQTTKASQMERMSSHRGFTIIGPDKI